MRELKLKRVYRSLPVTFAEGNCPHCFAKTNCKATYILFVCELASMYLRQHRTPLFCAVLPFDLPDTPVLQAKFE